MCAKKMASVNVHAFSAGSVCTHTFITIVEQNFSVNLIADQRKLVLFLLLCFCVFFLILMFPPLRPLGSPLSACMWVGSLLVANNFISVTSPGNSSAK